MAKTGMNRDIVEQANPNFKIMGMDTGSLSTNISISEFIYFSSKYLIVFYIEDYSVRTV